MEIAGVRLAKHAGSWYTKQSNSTFQFSSSFKWITYQVSFQSQAWIERHKKN